MWFLFSILSAFCSGMVAVFSKVSSSNADVYLEATIKAFFMALSILIAALALGRINYATLNALEFKDWVMSGATGIVGGLGWLFFFIALSTGSVSNVVAINQFAILFAFILSFLILSESISFFKIVGGIIMIIGSWIIVYL